MLASVQLAPPKLRSEGGSPSSSVSASRSTGAWTYRSPHTYWAVACELTRSSTTCQPPSPPATDEPSPP